MADTKLVRILKQIKVEKDGKRAWAMYPVVLDGRGRVTDTVMISGKPENHPEGTFYLDWWDEGKRYRASAGTDRAEALQASQRKWAELHAVRSGIAVEATERTGKRISDAIDEYLDTNRKLATQRKYTHVLKLFKESCPKRYVNDVTREDMLSFLDDCEEQNCGNKTRALYLRIVNTFLKHFDVLIRFKRGDRPRSVEALPEAYTPEELNTLFENSNESQATLFKFYLGTGFRDQEGDTVTWADVDEKHSAIRVRSKPLWGFTPKNWEERTVTVPRALIDRLTRLKERINGKPTEKVFSIFSGRHWKVLKEIAHRANLNCGQCVTRYSNRCVDGPHCEKFYLHKFRHTFAIENLRSGMNIKDLQLQLGHKDVETTMIYLRAYTPQDLRAKVEAGSLAGLTA